MVHRDVLMHYVYIFSREYHSLMQNLLEALACVTLCRADSGRRDRFWHDF